MGEGGGRFDAHLAASHAVPCLRFPLMHPHMRRPLPHQCSGACVNTGGGGRDGLAEVQPPSHASPPPFQDVASGPIWKEYIVFLQAPKPGTEAFAALFPTAASGQEEAARAVTLR